MNLYGFCGNDGIDNFDINGNSWLSKLWDHTILKIGQQIAINWDHQGRQYVEMAAAIAAAYFGGEFVGNLIYAPEGMTVSGAGTMSMSVTVTADSGALASSVVSGAMSAGMASTIAGVAGGAAGGFISGASLGAMSGQNLGQALNSGLEGAEFGAIEGGISAAEAGLNGSYLQLRPLSTDPMNDLRDLALIAGRGVETGIANTLEDKNASSGFWSGVLSGAGSLFTPAPWPAGWSTLGDDLAKGVLGGLGSMNKHGKGFMTGFWSAEATAASSFIDNELKYENPSGAGFENDAFGVAAKGILSGSAARLGFKTFSSGLFTGLMSEASQDAISAGQGNPEKPHSFSGAITNGYNFLQPKVVKGHAKLPLDNISAGTWGRGAPWAELYGP